MVTPKPAAQQWHPVAELSSTRLRTPGETALRLSVSSDTVIRYYDSGELKGVDMAPDEAIGHRRMPRFRDEDIASFQLTRGSRE
jgi:hypothetical protein